MLEVGGHSHRPQPRKVRQNPLQLDERMAWLLPWTWAGIEISSLPEVFPWAVLVTVLLSSIPSLLLILLLSFLLLWILVCPWAKAVPCLYPFPWARLGWVHPF